MTNKNHHHGLPTEPPVEFGTHAKNYKLKHETLKKNLLLENTDEIVFDDIDFDGLAAYMKDKKD